MARLKFSIPERDLDFCSIFGSWRVVEGATFHFRGRLSVSVVTCPVHCQQTTSQQGRLAEGPPGPPAGDAEPLEDIRPRCQDKGHELQKTFYTEQMDAEGLGRKLLLTPSGDPRKAPEKQTVGTVTASHKMLTLQAPLSELSQCQHWKEGLSGPSRGVWVPSGSLSPKTAASLCTL